MKQETGKTKEGEVTKVDSASKLPVNLMEEHSGAGLENLQQEDLSMPFIKILMPLSPQANKGDNRYIAGAEPGNIFNTATKRLYDGVQGIQVIPC